jgi:trimethylamine:corrinoid methyltransferase-like protein
VDCDVKDQVQRLLGGLDLDDHGYDWVQEVREGVEGVFAGLHSTADHHRATYWHPQLFERGFMHFGGESERSKLALRAREMVAELVASHCFELDAPRRREMDRIYERAAQELA